MHSTSTEITDRSARRTMKGRGSATSFSSIMLDKSVIILIQKMPLLCVRSSGPPALAPSFFTFQRGEGPLLVAFGFVKEDTAAYTIPVLDLLGSRDEVGVAARKETEGASCDCVVVGSGLSSDPAFQSQRQGAATS